MRELLTAVVLLLALFVGMSAERSVGELEAEPVAVANVHHGEAPSTSEPEFEDELDDKEEEDEEGSFSEYLATERCLIVRRLGQVRVRPMFSEYASFVFRPPIAA